MAGTWSNLGKQPGVNIDTMLLLTDGRVFCHEFQSNKWHTLTPSDAGDYGNGTWNTVQPMPDNAAIPSSFGGPTNAPTFFASAVLADGRVFVAGGEYNLANSNSNDTLAAQIFDPRNGHWTAIPTPPGWDGIGDAASCVLPDGQVMLGQFDGNAVALYHPGQNQWTFTSPKGDSCSEETFTLMPDNTVVTVQCSNPNHAEKYDIAADKWVSAGTTPKPLTQPCNGGTGEVGPAILLPNGKLLAVGATGNTAIYDPARPAASAWTAGPTLKDKAGKTSFPMDAPGVLLPNGKVLLAGSPAPPCSFPGPTTFFEYDPATNKAQVVASPPGGGAGVSVFQARFLLLPTGTVLYSNNSSTISRYFHDGTPAAAWKPTISHAPADLVPGHTHTLSGTQFNGLSQACSYGDDAQMATNYPLVRIVNTATRKVRYLPTAHHSTMGVATGTTPVSTTVTVPGNVPAGQYSLVVVANGIASDPVSVKVSPKPAPSS